MSENLSVYDASAGSGKTHTLSDQFSRYLLDEYGQDPNSYRHILAVTFTNKATCEMKQRIIDSLWKISQKSPCQKDRDNATAILKNMVHDYTMFRVSTIDSFFQKVLKAFALDMGRRGAFETTLDSPGAVEASVDAMYSKIGEDAALQDIMKGIALSRIDNGENWNWRNDVLAAAQNVLNLDYQNLLRKSKVAPGSLISTIDSFKKRENDLKKVFVDELIRLDDKKQKSFDASGLRKEIFKDQSKSALWKFISGCSYLDKAKREVTSPCPSIIEDWHSCSDGYFKDNATSDDIKAVTSIMDGTLEIKSLYDKYYAEYVTLGLVNPKMREIVLLDFISKELYDYLDKERLTLLSDAPQILKDLINGSDAPFIYEKIGSAINHYLLDEFQDTSIAQWENFLPLLKEGISNGRKSMLVGDVKQSIYRWRGGDWNLFKTEVQNEFPYDIKKNDLSDNYRSLYNIVEFNNLLFAPCSEDSPGFLVNTYKSYLESRGCDSAYTSLVADIYKNSRQTVKKDGDQKGVVDVISCRNAKDGNCISSKDFILIDLVRKIKSLTEGEKPIYNLGDIAVLSSNKADNRLVADFLIKNGITIVSGESLLVGGNEYVSLLVEALRKIEDPSSTGLEALSRVSSVKVKNPSLVDSSTEEGAAFIEKLFSGNTLFEICKKILKEVLPEISPMDITYVNAFLDNVLDYSCNYGTSLSSFLKWWDDHSSECYIPEPPSVQAVRIMTMHKAKGLGFKVVFLPFLREDLLPLIGQNWFLPDSPIAGYNGPLLIDFRSKNLKNSLFSKSYQKEQMERCVDNLNLAYVSFTRPKERLYIYAPREKSNYMSPALVKFCESNSGEGGLFIKNEGLYVDIDESKDPFCYTEYVMGDPQERSYAELHKETEDKLYDEEEVDASALSGILSNESVKTRLVSKWDGDDNVRRGVLWHQLYSMIEEVGEGENGLEEAVKKAVGKFLRKNPASLLGSDAESLEKEVLAKISGVATFGWFDSGKKVMNEASILSGSDMWRPDRVLLPADGSKDWAQVLDYKFGAYVPDSVQHKSYEKQVKNYMKLLKEMGYSHVEGHLWYVLNGGPVLVKLS